MLFSKPNNQSQIQDAAKCGQNTWFLDSSNEYKTEKSRCACGQTGNGCAYMRVIWGGGGGSFYLTPLCLSNVRIDLAIGRGRGREKGLVDVCVGYVTCGYD